MTNLCAMCEKEIEESDTIARDLDNELVHEQCHDDAERAGRR